MSSDMSSVSSIVELGKPGNTPPRKRYNTRPTTAERRRRVRQWNEAYGVRPSPSYLRYLYKQCKVACPARVAADRWGRFINALDEFVADDSENELMEVGEPTNALYPSRASSLQGPSRASRVSFREPSIESDSSMASYSVSNPPEFGVPSPTRSVSIPPSPVIYSPVPTSPSPSPTLPSLPVPYPDSVPSSPGAVSSSFMPSPPMLSSPVPSLPGPSSPVLPSPEPMSPGPISPVPSPPLPHLPKPSSPVPSPSLPHPPMPSSPMPSHPSHPPLIPSFPMSSSPSTPSSSSMVSAIGPTPHMPSSGPVPSPATVQPSPGLSLSILCTSMTPATVPSFPDSLSLPASRSSELSIHTPPDPPLSVTPVPTPQSPIIPRAPFSSPVSSVDLINEDNPVPSVGSPFSLGPPPALPFSPLLTTPENMSPTGSQETKIDNSLPRDEYIEKEGEITVDAMNQNADNIAADALLTLNRSVTPAGTATQTDFKSTKVEYFVASTPKITPVGHNTTQMDVLPPILLPLLCTAPIVSHSDHPVAYQVEWKESLVITVPTYTVRLNLSERGELVSKERKVHKYYKVKMVNF